MKWNQGFTLLEVLICVVLVAAMLAIALPEFGTFQRKEEQKKVARDVFVALRLARGYAVSQNLEYQVAFDLDSGRYWLEMGNLARNSTDWNRVREFGSFPPRLKMATKSECTWTAGDGDSSTADNYIQFNPNGTCGSSGLANSRYICVLDEGMHATYRSGVPSSLTGRIIINSL